MNRLNQLLFSIFFLSILFTTAAEKTMSQRLGIGITGGMNVTSHLNNFRFVSGDIDLDFTPGMKTGFTGGLIVRRPISEKLRFQAEPTISMMGAKYDDDFVLRGFDFETDSRTRLYYVQLPLLVQFTTVPPERTVYGRQPSETTFHVTGGVFGGYLLDAQFTGANSGAPIGIEFQGAFTENVKGQYKEYDGGVIFGGGLEHGSQSKIGLEARIMFSVLDSGNAPDLNFKPQNMAVSLSIYYLL